MLLLGAVFIFGESNVVSLRNKIKQMKIANNFTKDNGDLREIKYNKILSPKDLNVAKQAIDMFFGSTNTFFRCCVVPWKKSDLARFGKRTDLEKLKKAILYTNLTKKFIKLWIGDFKNVSLIYDNLVRCRGDEFEKIILENFGPKDRFGRRVLEPKIKAAVGIQSDLENNNIVQIADLLTGCVLNNIKPSSGRKNSVRDYLVKKLGVTSLKKSVWENRPTPETRCGKTENFHVEYIGLEDIVDMRKKTGKAKISYKKRRNRHL